MIGYWLVSISSAIWDSSTLCLCWSWFKKLVEVFFLLLVLGRFEGFLLFVIFPKIFYLLFVALLDLFLFLLILLYRIFSLFPWLLKSEFQTLTFLFDSFQPYFEWNLPSLAELALFAVIASICEERWVILKISWSKYGTRE